MNSIRIVISKLFEYPMESMTFPSYFHYVNTAGKVTARSVMDLCSIMLTFIEEQEKKNEQFEQNFKNIESILQKLVDQKGPSQQLEPNSDLGGIGPEGEAFICDVCGKVFKAKIGLVGHKRSHQPQPAVV